MKVMDTMYMNKVRDGSAWKLKSESRLQRFVLPLISGEEDVLQPGVNLVKFPHSKCVAKKCESKSNQIVVQGEFLCEESGIELYTFNHNFFGRSYRFMYATGEYFFVWLDYV